MPPRTRFAIAGLVLAVAAACSGGSRSPAVTAPDVTPTAPRDLEMVPVMVSSELAVGENRMLFTLIDSQNQVIASADIPVALHFEPADTSCAAQDAEGRYMAVEEEPGAVEEERGLYRAAVTFDCAGDWSVDVTAQLAAGERTSRVGFQVREASSTPGVGEDAPATENPTAESPDDIAGISTDDDPDPDFYRSSEADVLASGRPFVIVFATPAFCQTRACGPTLDVVKAAASDFKDRLEFIHVEPYELEVRDGALQPVLAEGGGLQSVEAVVAWGLLSEPYVFVVDAEGRVAAKFEAIAAEDELTAAFEAVAEG